MNLAILGKRIRALREQRGLKQTDIANALQVSPQAVSKWERGENAPDISVWLNLSQLLGVSCDTLLGRVEAADTFEATIFCTSLNRFAERCKRKAPRDVALWANGIFFTVTEAVLKHDGVPVKYVGDGFLGFFSGPRHAERAFEAARDAKRLIETKDLIIVLHTGNVYLGHIGHKEYARLDIIGDTVNRAFFTIGWVSANLPGGVAITEATRASMEKPPTLGKAQSPTLPVLNEKIKLYPVVVKE